MSFSWVHTRSHWVFDMDGTLTVPVHDFAAIRQTLELPAGRPILEAIAELPAEQRASRTRQLEQLEHELIAQTRAQPGASAFLAALQSRGARMGILTRNSRRNAQLTLEAAGLSEYFTPEEILGRDCCLAKPHPAGIQKLLQHWSATPDEAVMLGDDVMDLEAAAAAGVLRAHFDCQGTFRHRDYADHCVSEYAHLQAALLHRDARRES